MKTFFLLPVVCALFFGCSAADQKFHSDVDSMSVGISGQQDAGGGYNAALTATFKFRDPRHTADNK
jgi:hypothetical protein